MKKIFLALVASSFSLMSMSSMAGAYDDRGYVTSITADKWGDCSFQLLYKETTGGTQGIFWSCSNTAGKNMLYLAEKAQKANKKVKVYLNKGSGGNMTLYSMKILEWPDQD